MGVVPKRDQKPRSDKQQLTASATVRASQDAHAGVVAGSDQRQRLARAHGVDTGVQVVPAPVMVRTCVVAPGMPDVVGTAVVALGCMAAVVRGVPRHMQHPAGLQHAVGRNVIDPRQPCEADVLPVGDPRQGVAPPHRVGAGLGGGGHEQEYGCGDRRRRRASAAKCPRFRCWHHERLLFAAVRWDPAVPSDGVGTVNRRRSPQTTPGPARAYALELGEGGCFSAADRGASNPFWPRALQRESRPGRAWPGRGRAAARPAPTT